MKIEQQQLLAKPFALAEHGFKKTQVYIRKSAIRRRLSQVDPQWKLTEPEFICVDGDVVIMRGGLTVCGITRYQIGSGIIQRKAENGSDLQGYTLASMVAKAYKSAATDIVSRAAIEFNVGAYIKDAPVKPTSETALKELLEKLNAADSGHWSQSGGRERVMEMLKVLGMDWKSVNTLVEPDRVLNTLSETTLTEAAFMKRLVELVVKPAQPKAADLAKDYGTRAVIECDTKYLEPGDIIMQSGSPSVYLEVMSLPVMGSGTFPYQLTVKNLATDETKSVQYGGIAYHQLVAGPKVKAYSDNPGLGYNPAHGLIPKWDPKPLAPVITPKLPVMRCETRDLEPGDIIVQKTRLTETRIEVLEYWGQLAVGQYKLAIKVLSTGEEKSVIWSNSEHPLVDGPKCKAYAADESVCTKKGDGPPIWTAVRASV